VVRLVEDDIVVVWQDARLRLGLAEHEVAQIERVVDHDQVGVRGGAARLVVEAAIVVAALLAAAGVLVRRDLVPGRIRERQLGHVARVGLAGPLGEAPEQWVHHMKEVGLGGVEVLATEIVAAALHEHGMHFGLRQQPLDKRNILLNELGLEVDGMRGDNRHLAASRGPEGGDEIPERLADARTGLDEAVSALVEGRLDRPAHLDLLRPMLIGREQFGERTVWTEECFGIWKVRLRRHGGNR
jgi:hypothetical protein